MRSLRSASTSALSLWLAAATLLGCGAPSADPTAAIQLGATVSDYGDDGVWACGLAGATVDTGGSTECSLPGSKSPGLEREVHVFFNCRRRIPSNSSSKPNLLLRELVWSRCENGVTHPSNGQPTTYYEAYGCRLINGVCRVPTSLPPSLLPGALDTTTPEGAILAHLVDRLTEADAQVHAEGGPNLTQRVALLDASALFLDLAQTALLQEDYEEAGRQLSWGALALDLGTDFVPGVSLAKDLITIAIGINPVTGQTVSDTERALVTASLVVPGFWKGVSGGVTAAVAHLDDLAVAGGRSARLAGELADVFRHSDELLARLTGWVLCGAQASRLRHPLELCTVGTLTAELAESTLTSGRSRGIVVGEGGHALFFASEEVLADANVLLDDFLPAWRKTADNAFAKVTGSYPTKGSADALRANMAEMLGLGRSGLVDANGIAAHHIIPQELIAADSPVRAVLQNAGLQIDAVGNGLLLPGKGAATHVLNVHVGKHSDYTAVVREYLLKIDPTLPEAELRARVTEVMERAVRVLTSGDVPLHRLDGYTGPEFQQLLRDAFERAAP